MKLTEEQIARLKSLEDDRGALTPDLVVEDAKNKKSPLHGLFEWDIRKAAATQWIQQAREIIGAVRIVVTTTEATIKAPVYVRDPEADGQGYRNVASLRRDPAQAREAMIYALDVAAGHVRRAYDLAEPLGLAGEVDLLLQQIVGVRRVVEAAA